MFTKVAGVFLAAASLALFGMTSADAQDKDKKKREGTIIGEVKGMKPTPNKVNVFVEILAAGEERARTYRVQYDPAVKGPIAKVLEAVKAAKVGDRVQADWIDTGEGLALKTFQVLKKDDAHKKEEGKKDDAKKTSTVIGELKTRTDTKDGKNSVIEVLAPGEEKARSYHVIYDQKYKGPVPSVLAAVRAAKIGDRVELEFVGTNHGPAITAFKVFQKAPN